MFLSLWSRFHNAAGCWLFPIVLVAKGIAEAFWVDWVPRPSFHSIAGGNRIFLFQWLAVSLLVRASSLALNRRQDVARQIVYIQLLSIVPVCRIPVHSLFLLSKHFAMAPSMSKNTLLFAMMAWCFEQQNRLHCLLSIGGRLNQIPDWTAYSFGGQQHCCNMVDQLRFAKRAVETFYQAPLWSLLDICSCGATHPDFTSAIFFVWGGNAKECWCQKLLSNKIVAIDAIYAYYIVFTVLVVFAQDLYQDWRSISKSLQAREKQISKWQSTVLFRCIRCAIKRRYWAALTKMRSHVGMLENDGR